MVANTLEIVWEGVLQLLIGENARCCSTCLLYPFQGMPQNDITNIIKIEKKTVLAKRAWKNAQICQQHAVPIGTQSGASSSNFQQLKLPPILEKFISDHGCQFRSVPFRPIPAGMYWIQHGGGTEHHLDIFWSEFQPVPDRSGQTGQFRTEDCNAFYLFI